MPLYELEKNGPEIHSDVFVAPSATIIGNVSVSANSSIWFGSVLRGDAERISIGVETNIQDMTMIHADPGKPAKIGNRVTIGHRCIIHGCTIEDSCLIGMGAIVMNGAVIGKGSIVGAGSVILEDTIIPPFSMVAGMPGKVKKSFEENIIEIIDASSKVYVDRSVAYKDSSSFTEIK